MNLVENADFTAGDVVVDGLSMPSRWAGRHITGVSGVDGVLSALWDYVDDWSIPLVVCNAARGEGFFTTDVPAEPGMPYRLAVLVGGDAPVLTVQLRVGGVVLAEQTVAPASHDFATTPVEIAGSAPTDYVFTGGNGLHLAVTGEGSILLTDPVIVADAPSTVTVTDPGPQSARVGEPFALALTGTTTDDDPALSWSTTGLPDGLTLAAGGYVTGTPSTEGVWPVVLTATDGTGQTGHASVDFTVTTGQALPDPASYALARQVAAFIGRANDADTTALAAAHVPVVIEFVRGYTRGQGFTGDAPSGPLRAVIVSSAARLLANPEQLSFYVSADYSERPPLLHGWTLPEIGVLHRYRKRATG